MFTGERSEETSYASVTVAAPPGPAPTSGGIQVGRADGNDPAQFRHRRRGLSRQAAFPAAISTAAKQSGRGKVLVFVHGFNNRFDDAVYRVAQVVHDSAPEHPGAVHLAVARRASLRAYAYDRESAIYSRDTLEQLLDILAANRA